MAVLAADTEFVPFCVHCNTIATNPPALTIKEWGGLVGILSAMEFFGWTIQHVMSKIPPHKLATFAAELESFTTFVLAHHAHGEAIVLRSADGNHVTLMPVATIGQR